MTISPICTTSVRASVVNSAWSFCRAAFGVLAVWFFLLALITVAVEPESTVLVFGREKRLYAALASSETRLVANGTGFIRVRGTSSGFVADLYRHGAWLVLPGSAFGCGAGAASVSRAPEPRTYSNGLERDS